MTIDFALGTGLLSTDAHPLVRVTGLADTRALLDAYAQNGGNLIDSASIYPAIFKQAGKAQKMLGQVDAAAKSAYGFTVDSKVNSFVPGKGNRPEHIRECLEETIKDLKVNHVNVLYLHTVDHSTPLIDSIRAVDELFKEGKLKEFGISNFSPARVRETFEIARENNLIKPTVYQGEYNLLNRGAEEELVPLMHENGGRFYGFSPMAGGFLSGQHSRGQTPTMGRWDTTKEDNMLGDNYMKRYYSDSSFDAIDALQAEADKLGISLPTLALRWLAHHSALAEAHGDRIVIGAGSPQSIQRSYDAVHEGKLPAHVVGVIDQAWQSIKTRDPPTFHH